MAGLDGVPEGAGAAAEAVVTTALEGTATEARSQAPETRKGPHPGRRIVTVALLLAMTVASLEQTVVSTAMPSIIAALKGLDIYPWVFSAYLLAATVTTPLYGKLADLLGRKRVLLFGLGLFAAGSMLSGLARSMPELIAMRVVQGLGAGAVGPIVLTMLGDLFTIEERARVQGWFSAVWGVASLAGPTVGGVLTDQLSWRWVFFVTVPFALVSAWILIRHVHETIEPRKVAPIDVVGAVLLALGSVVLLLAVLKGVAVSWSWTVSLLVLAGFMLGSFLVWEQIATDPVLPLDLILSAHLGPAIAGSFLSGALLFGLDTYIPLYVQGVLGGSATEAGRMITPLFLSWAVSAAVAAQVVGRLGFRRTAVAGTVLITTGTLGVTLGAARPGSAMLLFAAGMVVIGMGMGPTSLSFVLAVQNAVDWGRRGAATGAVIFFRMMGGALGVGTLGAVLGYGLAQRLLATPAGAGIDVTAALRPETHARLTIDQLRVVQDALGLALRDVFFQIVALAVLAILCSVGLRGGRAVPQSHPQLQPQPPEDPDGSDTLNRGSAHGISSGMESVP
jgi:MFS family permease